MGEQRGNRGIGGAGGAIADFEREAEAALDNRREEHALGAELDIGPAIQRRNNIAARAPVAGDHERLGGDGLLDAGDRRLAPGPLRAWIGNIGGAARQGMQRQADGRDRAAIDGPGRAR